MIYIHNICEGTIEAIVGFDGCYDDNYGLCLKCGTEGELVVKEINEMQGLVVVSIKPTTSRHELPASDSPDNLC